MKKKNEKTKTNIVQYENMISNKHKNGKYVLSNKAIKLTSVRKISINEIAVENDSLLLFFPNKTLYRKIYHNQLNRALF